MRPDEKNPHADVDYFPTNPRPSVLSSSWLDVDFIKDGATFLTSFTFRQLETVAPTGKVTALTQILTKR